jgi:5-methylthioadenosine/S-adenosylhomocysteine deaminase
MITVIAKAAWTVGWDSRTGGHAYLRDVDVAFQDDRIIFVGERFEGHADRTLDGRNRLVMPGLIDVHSHLAGEILGRGLIEELGNPRLYMSGLYDEKGSFFAAIMRGVTGTGMDSNASAVAATELAIRELLKSGVTTVVDLSTIYDDWIETFARSGIRGYLAPMYRQARWKVPTGFRLEYDWDEERGVSDFKAALTLIEAARAHPCGRLDGMLAPAQVDTCCQELFVDSLEAARERGLKLTTHCGQSVVEFQEMARRHGKTQVQWLNDIGLLGKDTILGHGIFLDHHSWVNWHTRDDVSLLARTGTSVAHCPLVFSRYGQMLENLGDYVRAGVNVAMGTDTEPQNMFEEMRLAVTLGRISARNVRAVELSDVFNAATIGGATALGRSDLGRIEVGAKADLVLADLTQIDMRPMRDPLRSLVFTAADRAVSEVFVDGRQVVSAGVVTTIDQDDAGKRAEAAQDVMISRVRDNDLRGRSADQIAPLVFPLAR